MNSQTITSQTTSQPEFIKLVGRRARLVAWSRAVARLAYATSEINRHNAAMMAIEQIESAIAH